MIYIWWRVKLLGKGKLELIFISDFSTYLYYDSTIYFGLPATPAITTCHLFYCIVIPPAALQQYPTVTD